MAYNNPNPFGNPQYASQFTQPNTFTPSTAVPPPLPPSSTDQLSFLSPSDQTKFQELFNNATNGNLSISPEAARSILLKSNLTPHHLASIWELADINRTGDLLFPEFALALHLCNVVLRGGSLPYQLDPHVQNEVSSYVDRISFNIPEEDSSIHQQKKPQSLNRSNTTDILEFQPVASDIPPFLSNQQTGYTASPTKTTSNQSKFLNYQPTGLANSTQSNSLIPSFQQQQTGYQQETTQPSFNQFNTQPVQSQATGLVPINGLSQQQTGYPPLIPEQSAPAASNGSGLTQQQTGFAQAFNTINPQPTGLVPLQNQTTGAQSVTQQPSVLAPLTTQLTGAALKQQPTGLVPLSTQLTGGRPLAQQPTGLIPIPTGGKSITQPLTQQPTGLVPLQSVQTGSAPLQSQKTGFGAFEPLRAQKTGVGQNSFFLSNLIQERPVQDFTNSLAYTNESITPQEKLLFNKIFQNYDTTRKGLLSADVCAEIFRKSGLNREELEKVWDLITQPNQTSLDRESFQIGMWLVYKRLNGFDLPEYLPESLKPSSLKILDDVKKQLKVEANAQRVKKSSNSKIDGSRFRNNDDEIKISTSRHRRRRTNTEELNVVAAVESNDKLSVEELKKKIWEKKILFEALETSQESITEQTKFENEEDAVIIEKLKLQLENLPFGKSKDDESSNLKQRFSHLTSKIPVFISQISDVDNQITNLKLELYKIQHPSSIIGSGAGGSITEADKRKSKSKALLALKMAKLTGKPIDPEIQAVAEEESKLSDEVVKIQQENQKNQKSIKDIQDSIDELSKGIQASLSNFNANDDDYKKFELGIGLQPEVQEIVKKFRSAELSNKFNNLKIETSLPSTPSPIATPSPITTPIASSHNFKSTEDRRAYIREQAKNKMNERLAKLGISRPSRVSSASSPSTPSISQPVIPSPIQAPAISQPRQPIQPVQAPPVEAPPVQALVPETHDNEQNEDSSSDDDDEEEFQRLEAIRKLKRLERDARLEELAKDEDQTTKFPPIETLEQPNFHKSNPFAPK